MALGATIALWAALVGAGVATFHYGRRTMTKYVIKHVFQLSAPGTVSLTVFFLSIANSTSTHHDVVQ